LLNFALGTEEKDETDAPASWSLTLSSQWLLASSKGQSLLNQPLLRTIPRGVWNSFRAKTVSLEKVPLTSTMMIWRRWVHWTE
jgi:hypothetical protein